MDKTISVHLPAFMELKRQWNALDWPNASLYCLVARAVYTDPAISGDLHSRFSPRAMATQLVGRACWVGYFGEDRRFLLRYLIGEDVRDFEQRTGSDLVDGYRCQLLCVELRYCEQCLRIGYHSTLFQHWSLARCPEHQCPFKIGCPSCRCHLVPTVRQVTSDPFACHECGHSFISSFMVERGAAGLKALDCRVGNLRQSLQARRPGINRSCFPGPLFDKGARTSRLARRFSAWTGEDALGSFREEVIVQTGALQVNDMQVEATNEAAVAALKRLYILCSDYWTEVESVYSRLSRSGSGVRLIGRASAVAAALCKTAFIFRLDYDSLIDPKYFMSTPSRGAKLISFSFEGRQLLTIQDLSRLRQLEIHGLFALSLIEICRYRRLSDIKWSRHVLPGRFVPSWCREQADDRTTVLRIRPRANESTVERLINRWRGHYLSDLDMSDHGPVAADR